MTTFVDMYHPALGNVHISVPDIPAALSLYEAHGWVLSTGGGPDPTPIDLTVGLGDLRYAKLGDIPTPGTATGDALRAAFDARYVYLPTVEALGGPPPANSGTPMGLNRTVFNGRPWQLRRTRARIARAVAGKGDGIILCIGDSNTFGFGAYLDGGDVAGLSWPERLAAQFAAEGVPVSPGGPFFPAPTLGRDSRWVTTGAYGIVNGLLSAFDTGASGTYTIPGQCSRISVTYLDRFGGDFTIAIDGGAPVTVTRAAGGNYNRWESGLLTLGAHTVTITGAPGVHVAYIEGRLDDQGIRIAKAGVSGSTAADWASTADLNYLDNALSLYPTLTVVMLGTNDMGRAPADVAADLSSIVTRVRATGSEVLIVGPPARSETDFSALYAALYPLAVTLDAPLLDLRERIGLYAEGKTYGVFSSSAGDTVHLSTVGLVDLGRAVHTALVA